MKVTAISLLKLVSAVRHVAAIKKKAPEFKRITFFGLEDIWKYTPVWDEKLCDECLRHARNEYYVGRHLRREMPYLEIIDENTIHAKIHPHCRCFLTRVTDLVEYIEATALIWGGLPWE